MKKTVLLLIVFLLAGCGGTPSKNTETVTNTPQTSTTSNQVSVDTSSSQPTDDSKEALLTTKAGQSGTATFKNPSAGDTLVYQFTYENSVIKTMTMIMTQELPAEAVNALPQGQKDAFVSQYVNAFKSQVPIPESKVETKIEGNKLIITSMVQMDNSNAAKYAQAVGDLSDEQAEQVNASKYVTIDLMEEQFKASGFVRVE